MTIILPDSVTQQQKRIQPAEGVDFVFVENDAKALTIKILKEPFQNVVYVYGAIKLREGPKEIDPNDPFTDTFLEGEDTATLTFNYEILENKDWVLTRNLGDFEWLVGRILETILTDAIENDQTKYDMFAFNEEGEITGINVKANERVDGKSMWKKFKGLFKFNG